jgi:hypothetical protein
MDEKELGVQIQNVKKTGNKGINLCRPVVYLTDISSVLSETDFKKPIWQIFGDMKKNDSESLIFNISTCTYAIKNIKL